MPAAVSGSIVHGTHSGHQVGLPAGQVDHRGRFGFAEVLIDEVVGRDPRRHASRRPRGASNGT